MKYVVHWMFAAYGAPLQKDISVEVPFSPVNRHPFVRAAFSLNRFSNLLNYLRFDDKIPRSARCERGVFCPISDLWDAFNSKLAKGTQTKNKLCHSGLDESLSSTCPVNSISMASTISGRVMQKMTIPTSEKKQMV